MPVKQNYCTMALMDGANQPDNSDGSWQYRPSDSAPTTSTTFASPEPVTPYSVASPRTGPAGSITWTASEFILHAKTPGWYGVLAGVAITSAIIVWLLTKDVISAVFILIAAAAFGVFAARQPRDLTYSLDDHGLTIGPKHFDYRAFRSFSVIREGAFSSIVFMPMKRFSPLTTIYYDPNDEPKIVALLSDRLPLEERKPDPVDRLMWRIRF